MVFDQLEREMVEHIDGPSPDWYGLCPGDTRPYEPLVRGSLVSLWSGLRLLFVHYCCLYILDLTGEATGHLTHNHEIQPRSAQKL
ncbi:MAG: hypothetical protein LVS60_09565 [Nodosilinea sp. LVE1205-7]|jgi:hypothetical protein